MVNVLDEIKSLKTDISSLRTDMDAQFVKFLYKTVGVIVCVLGALIVLIS